MKVLNLYRGAPGSGKSTLAHKNGGVVFEADQFHFNEKGYDFSMDKLFLAHKWCCGMVEECMQWQLEQINVANTFIKRRDLKPYIELSLRYGYKVNVFCLLSDFGSVHDVPLEKVQQMKNGLQPYDGEIIITGKDYEL